MAIDFAAQKDVGEVQEVIKVSQTDKKLEKNIFGVQTKKINIPDPIPEGSLKYTMDEQIPIDKIDMIDEGQFKPQDTLNIDEMRSTIIL